MEERTHHSKVVTHIIRGCLVVPIQGELYDELILQIQRDILEEIKQTGIKGVIVDLAGVDIIDSFLGRVVSDTAKMASMLGATTVLTGFKPAVVASLVDLDFEPGDIQTALTLEDGFHKLGPIVAPEEIEEVEEDLEEGEEPSEGLFEDETS